MSSIHRTVILLVGLAFVGCDQNPGQAVTAPALNADDGPEIILEIKGIPQPTPIRPIVPSVPVNGLGALSGTDAKQSVTGHYQFIGIATRNDYNYSLTAIRHEDGSVSGEFEERVLGPIVGLFRQTHGTVTCFQIVDNMARIGGVVDHANDPRYLGTEFRLNVVDNGEGASDPPDMGSNARFGGHDTAQAFCDAGAPFNLEPIEHGNIEVRP